MESAEPREHLPKQLPKLSRLESLYENIQASVSSSKFDSLHQQMVDLPSQVLFLRVEREKRMLSNDWFLVTILTFQKVYFQLTDLPLLSQSFINNEHRFFNDTWLAIKQPDQETFAYIDTTSFKEVLANLSEIEDPHYGKTASSKINPSASLEVTSCRTELDCLAYFDKVIRGHIAKSTPLKKLILKAELDDKILKRLRAVDELLEVHSKDPVDPPPFEQWGHGLLQSSPVQLTHMFRIGNGSALLSLKVHCEWEASPTTFLPHVLVEVGVVSMQEKIYSKLSEPTMTEQYEVIEVETLFEDPLVVKRGELPARKIPLDDDLLTKLEKFFLSKLPSDLLPLMYPGITDESILSELYIEAFCGAHSVRTNIKLPKEIISQVFGRNYFLRTTIALRPGTILIVPHRLTLGLSFHCGLYLGEDKMIHLAPLFSMGEGIGKRAGRFFRFCNISQFLESHGETVMAIYPSLQLFDEQELLVRAREMCQRLFTYNLATCNCEHVAWECLSGWRLSTQMEASNLRRNLASLADYIRNAIFKHGAKR